VTAAGIGYTAAVTLAALFAVAAVAKLRDPEEVVRSFEALGVPNPEATGRLLPLPELATVVLLMVVPPAGGIAALVLLAFFTTFIVRRVRAGVRAPCNCFGDVSARPLSWLAVARNGVFMVLAGLSLLTTRPVRPTLLEVAVVVGATVVSLVAIMVAGDRLADRTPDHR
jgi:hypothetical protein